MKPVSQPPVLSRRTALAFLTAAPATALANPLAPADLFTGSETSAGEPTPVMILFVQYQALRDRINSLPTTWTDAELEPHYQQLFKIEDAMMAAPPESAADFAAKVIVATCDAGLLPDWDTSDVWKEARALTGFGSHHSIP